MIDAIPKWALAALLAAFAVTSCKFQIDKNNLEREILEIRAAADEREAQYQKQRTLAAEKLAAATVAVVETQNHWVAAIAEERNRTDETIRHLHRTADNLRRRLRSAEEVRRATVTVAHESAGAASDEETSRRSAESVVPDAAGIDLVSEALRADTIRVELMACYADYDRVRDALIRFNSEIVPQ